LGSGVISLTLKFPPPRPPPPMPDCLANGSPLFECQRRRPVSSVFLLSHLRFCYERVMGNRPTLYRPYVLLTFIPVGKIEEFFRICTCSLLSFVSLVRFSAVVTIWGMIFFFFFFSLHCPPPPPCSFIISHWLVLSSDPFTSLGPLFHLGSIFLIRLLLRRDPDPFISQLCAFSIFSLHW